MIFVLLNKTLYLKKSNELNFISDIFIYLLLIDSFFKINIFSDRSDFGYNESRYMSSYTNRTTQRRRKKKISYCLRINQ